MIQKIEKLINYFIKQKKKILLIFDHIDFKFFEELKYKLKIDINEIPIIKIFSLDEYNIQKIFLEQIKMKPYKRDYLLMMKYPQINELSEKYSIFGKNPYYYRLRKTNNLSFNNLYNNERTKIFDIFESFYINNKRNVFYILSIKNLIGLDNFNYNNFIDHFKNIPLDLFKIELFDNQPGIKNIQFKNYLIEYSIKNFIRKNILPENFEPVIIDKMTKSNKRFLFEDLFDVFFVSDELPF